MFGADRTSRAGEEARHVFIWVTMTIDTDQEEEFLASITRDAVGRSPTSPDVSAST